MVIKVIQRMSYAKILKKLGKEVSPDAVGSKVVSARATQMGDVLILMDKGSNKEGFTAEVKIVVLGLGEVRKLGLTPKGSLSRSVTPTPLPPMKR